MSNLTIDTTAMQACTYNGNNVEKLIIDGTTVWEKFNGPFDITFYSYDNMYTYLTPSGSDYSYYEYTVQTDTRGKLDIEQIPAIGTAWTISGEGSPYHIFDGNLNSLYTEYNVQLLSCYEFYGPLGSATHADIAEMTFSSNEEFFARPTWEGFYSNMPDLELCASLELSSQELLSWWPLESTSGSIQLWIYTDPGSAEDPYSENWLVNINLTDYTQLMLERLGLPSIDINRDLATQILETNGSNYCPCKLYFQDINQFAPANFNGELYYMWEDIQSSINAGNSLEVGVRLAITGGTAFFPSAANVCISSDMQSAASDAGYYWLDSQVGSSGVVGEGYSSYYLDVEPCYFINALDARDADGNAYYCITPIIR